jgi:hypothetical protein
MSRVVDRLRIRHQQALTVLALGTMVVAGSVASAAAQELEACSGERIHDCVLADWSGAEPGGIVSVFGKVEPIAWVEDELGDAPAGGLDILAAGVGKVVIDEPEAVRETPGLRKLGKIKKAVPRGTAYVVRIVLDRAPEDVPGGHASIHVATDVDGSRSNNVPSGIAAPDNPFAGSQDVYSLTWASTTGKTRLLNSDLAKAWYKGKDPFATAWAAPGVLDVLIRPSTMGEGFRVITHAAGGEGGYDWLALGSAAIPVSGQVGLVPVCLEGSIVAEPFAVPRLVENGQVVRDVEARASWRGGFAVPVSDEERERLAGFIAERAAEEAELGADAVPGRTTIPTWVNLFEDGSVIRQRADLELGLDGEHALLATELGLTRRGYNVLRDFELDATGDPAVDAWLERATEALRETMPPFRLNKRGGLLVGEEAGACIPWLAPPATEPEASTPPADGDPASSA